MIGLDTGTIIDVFRGNENLKVLLEKNKEPLAITIITFLELHFGLNPDNPKHTAEALYYDELFKRVHTIQLNEESCAEASKISWNLKKEGKTIEKFDCVIAAQFLMHGVNKIITNNPKHFERIKGLAVISY